MVCFQVLLMHELGIAQNILQIVQQSVPEKDAADVRHIRIRVGRLSGIIPDSLDFCFRAIVNDTGMQRASLDIEQIPIVSECKDCMHRFQMDELDFSCPACKSSNLQLISGRELDIVEIELAEESDEAI
jgi:hydrogenase nickel incorporation protein HypA/HybF